MSVTRCLVPPQWSDNQWAIAVAHLGTNIPIRFIGPYPNRNMALQQHQSDCNLDDYDYRIAEVWLFRALERESQGTLTRGDSNDRD